VCFEEKNLYLNLSAVENLNFFASLFGIQDFDAMEVLRRVGLADRGAAVLLTTHDMFEADELSDRVAFINDGRIAALDTAENLKLQYGERGVKVRLRDGDGVREEDLGIGGEDSQRLAELAASLDLMTIHTEEATLEDIFIELTGRGLEG
jgi:ABC-type multidrug transport system ATPase subunit